MLQETWISTRTSFAQGLDANINSTATKPTNNENSAAVTTIQEGHNSEMKLTSQQYQALISLLQQTSTIRSSSSTQTTHINQLGIVPKTNYVIGSVLHIICTINNDFDHCYNNQYTN